MFDTQIGSWPPADLESPRRNHFFHGKLLDAYHFELETDYFNAKRWLLNRLVLGAGVVAGLDVVTLPDAPPDQIAVTPGVAIDYWGREIVVPTQVVRTVPKGLATATGQPGTGHPPASAYDEVDEDEDDDEADEGYDDGDEEDDDDEAARGHHGGGRKRRRGWLHLLLCYHECLEDPAPVLAGDCHTSQPCEPGTVREWYKLVFRPGKLPKMHLYCNIEDVLGPRQINYDTIVRWMAQWDLSLPRDACIPLANLRVNRHGHCHPDEIDIAVRPVVYTNQLLFEMFLDLVRGQRKSGARSRNP